MPALTITLHTAITMGSRIFGLVLPISRLSNMLSTAADEVHDLDGVAVRDLARRMIGTRDDLTVDLHGHGTVSKTEVRDELAHGHMIGDVTKRSIDCNLHGFLCLLVG